MNLRIRVLVIEDSEDDAQLLMRELRRRGYEADYTRVETADAMASALTAREWDVVISDYSLPQFNAPQALRVFKDSGLDLPFIAVSGTLGEEAAVATMKAGAHDYLTKGNLSRLVPAIERELREAEERRRRKKAEEELRRIEWMLSPDAHFGGDGVAERITGTPDFGDLTELNADGLILRSVGKATIEDILSDCKDLLDTAVMVNEKNGNYALGAFSLGWCQFMNQSSRQLCGSSDNATALACGQWLCHQSCWGDASLVSIKTAEPVDIACNGGIRAYAVPISAGDEIIGSISFGYGDPPRDPVKLAELAAAYGVAADVLHKRALAYESRPAAIIQVAKRRLQSAARLIGQIVERKQVEQELAEQTRQLARSNADLQQFAYVASHDLQEPLRMIGSFTQLIAKRYKGNLDSDADEYIFYVVDGVARMKRLINDLLEYSRVGTNAKAIEPIDCQEALKRVLASLQFAIEETGAVVTHGLLPTVSADDTQLGQLFQNLIGNAIKFHGDQPPRISVQADRAEDEWVFSVSDNGIGMDSQYFDRIFVVFQQLHTSDKYSGTGIGLAICKKIVERHGGRIWVESTPGVGTTFYFTLPVRPPIEPGGTKVWPRR